MADVGAGGTNDPPDPTEGIRPSKQDRHPDWRQPLLNPVPDHSHLVVKPLGLLDREPEAVGIVAADGKDVVA